MKKSTKAIDFIEAHRAVLKEIQIAEKVQVTTPEEAYAKLIFVKALEERANAIRAMARNVPKEEEVKTFVDKGIEKLSITIWNLKNKVGMEGDKNV